MATVEVSGVSKSFGSAVAVDSTDLLIPNGTFFSLLGPSGSGKTTLLRLVAGFYRPDSGTIRIGGAIVNDVPPHKRNIGMVFQSYALFPHRTALENASFGLEMRGASREAALKAGREALALVRMDTREGAYPRQLSGGQQQRVAIARSIAARPAVWLLDEPLSALDRKLRVEMQVELRALQRHLGITALYVTHDQEEALAMSDSIAIFNDGRIAQKGTARELYERPRSAFVAEFLGSANLLPATLARDGASWFAEIDGRRFPLTEPGSFAPGQKVQLAVRPERMIVGVEPSGEALPATVQDLVYLGSDVRMGAVTAAGTRFLARVPSTGRPELRTLREGDRVFARWKAEDAVLV